MNLVIDASVACKWFFDEPQSLDARRLLASESTLIAPSIVLAEVANVYWKRLRGGLDISAQASVVIQRLAGMFKLVPEEVLLCRAFEIARLIDHPIYDCFYIAASEYHHAPLVTSDLRLLKRLERTPWCHSVVALADFETKLH
jgi:predicted nucleic acid-binding protein